jgi:hypothetical protein
MGGKVTSVFRGGFFSDTLRVTGCEANGVDELGLGRLNRKPKSRFRFRRMGNNECLRGCYVWQARNIKFGSLVKKNFRGS